MAAMRWEWETPAEGSEIPADRDFGYGAVGVGVPHMARDPPPEPSQAPWSGLVARRSAVSVCAGLGAGLELSSCAGFVEGFLEWRLAGADSFARLRGAGV